MFLGFFVMAAILTGLGALILVMTTANSSGVEGRRGEEDRPDGLRTVRVRNDTGR